VDIEFDADIVRGTAPRATQVQRRVQPLKLEGRVKSFESAKGWGFLLGEDGIECFLHRSDVIDGKIPIRGQRVVYYRGTKLGKPRAFYVEV